MIDEFLTNNATIVIQPKQNFHYRYASDLERGDTHGVLSGQKEGHPKIKLLLPEGGHCDDNGKSREFYVLCTMHSFDHTNKVLSPHLLIKKGEKQLNYSFIFEKMKIIADSPVERVWALKDYVIVRLKESEYKTSFGNKQNQYQNLALPLDFSKILGRLNLNEKLKVKHSGKLNVCLGFTIFERDFHNKTYSLYRDTIYSCNIYHGDDLRIHLLCNLKGNVLGGTTVTILMRFESNLPLNVFIKKIDETTKRTVWSNTVDVSKDKLFRNSAITFIMPAYGGPESTDDEIEVLLCVRVGDTTYKSNYAKFYYIRERSLKSRREMEQADETIDKPEKQLKESVNKIYVSRDQAELPEHSTLVKSVRMSINGNINQKINDIFNVTKNRNHIFTYEYLESILYDALETTDALIHLYKTANASTQKHLVAEFRNEYRENLLHYACKMNIFQSIRPLIRLGCRSDEKDNNGRTPLHVALDAQHTDCILEIQKLINEHSDYSKEVEENFIKMFKAYNHNGHTVLHAAVLDQHKELLEIMFKFLEKHNINVLDYEVLGSGDSIAHLAIQNNLKNIWPQIQKYVPNYKMVQNYAGMTIMDLGEEMLEKLKI